MRKSLGQHFIFDTNILRKILKFSEVKYDDTVVEIGPGLGTLTALLAESSKKVVAIEFDRKLIARLEEKFSVIPNVQIVQADALKFPYDTIKNTFKVVANIPFGITTPLLFRLLEHRDRIATMTLLIQKEVAKRIVASPGSKEYGVLSISMQLYTKPDLKFTVNRKVFSPPPDVDSAVVHFRVYPKALFKIEDTDFFFKVVKTAFSQRRKMLINSLKSFRGINEALQKSGIDARQRPENLSIRDFTTLSKNLK